MSIASRPRDRDRAAGRRRSRCRANRGLPQCRLASSLRRQSDGFANGTGASACLARRRFMTPSSASRVVAPRWHRYFGLIKCMPPSWLGVAMRDSAWPLHYRPIILSVGYLNSRFRRRGMGWFHGSSRGPAPRNPGPGCRSSGGVSAPAHNTSGPPVSSRKGGGRWHATVSSPLPSASSPPALREKLGQWQNSVGHR